MPESAQLRATVRGRVQGVGFRYFVVRRARELGLGGWVRNRPDGTVECLAVGPRPTLERFAGQLQTGPGRVQSIDTTWESPALSPDATDFHIVA